MGVVDHSTLKDRTVIFFKKIDSNYKFQLSKVQWSLNFEEAARFGGVAICLRPGRQKIDETHT